MCACMYVYSENLLTFLSFVVILGFRSGCVEVRVAEICSVSYVDVMELHCSCGLVARTVKSESAVFGVRVWEGCARDLGKFCRWFGGC
jgi:hypothetical protein